MDDLAAEVKRLREQLAVADQRFEAELEKIRAEAHSEIEQLRRERDAAQNTIKRAKDPNPISRPNFKRVIKLVQDACMELARIAGGWRLKLGHKQRRFKSLKEIWELLLADDWHLGDIFPDEHKVCYTSPGIAPRLEDDNRLPQKEEVKQVVRAGQPPGISIEHLAAEWRMFPTSRPHIREVLQRLGQPSDLFG